jgi:hypothetical protein
MSKAIPTRGLSHKELDVLMRRVRETIIENLKKGSAKRDLSEEEREKRPHDGMEDAGARVEQPQG